MQFILKKTDNTTETHIKKNFSSDEMKKRIPDNQNLNTFSEENKSILWAKFMVEQLVLVNSTKENFAADFSVFQINSLG
nr:hypothetical protein [uncultured Flavobacterium sp.]